MKKTALVLFSADKIVSGKQVIAHRKWDSIITNRNNEYVTGRDDVQFLETFLGPGSIYEATQIAEKISNLKVSGGRRVSSLMSYKGYQLWWIHYTQLFLYICLPYTQYRKLLVHLIQFDEVWLYNVPFPNLFKKYLEAHGVRVHGDSKHILSELHIPKPGIILQIFFTILSIPFLVIKRTKIMLFTSDQFDGAGDYDFRMSEIYKELRKRKIPFYECIRSLESWKTVLNHACKRQRPVIYPEAIKYISRLLAIGSLRHTSKVREIRSMQMSGENREEDFFLACALEPYDTFVSDVWTIRLTRFILKLIGTQAAFITAGVDRTYPTLIACKLSKIYTVGILHAYASRYYNHYDFLPSYDGNKNISVDIYGVWSEWWKKHYIEHSKLYAPENLHISGMMRPVKTLSFEGVSKVQDINLDKKVQVLLVSEIVAVPEEVFPYLEALLNERDRITVHIKFRVHNDSFESWLKDNHPGLLNEIPLTCIHRGGMQEAIHHADVVVGSQSTGVIESVLQDKPFIFFNTQKWGDYFDLQAMMPNHHVFAQSPELLVEYVLQANSIPVSTLRETRDHIFGDLTQNGSAWVVSQLEAHTK